MKSGSPSYEIRLPSGFEETATEEPLRRFIRFRGRDTWTKVTAVVASSLTVLPQPKSGIQPEDILPLIPLPPDAKWTFAPMKWKDFEIGSIEYRAVVNNLPVVGMATVLPMTTGTVTLLFSAPTPLEKECREEFAATLLGVIRAPTHWHSPEYYQKVRTLDRVGVAGLALVALYPMAWAVFFRGEPLRAHWVRTLWLAAAAVVLFIPISSPGDTTVINNMLVNGVLPVILLLFAARRIKLGIEEG